MMGTAEDVDDSESVALIEFMEEQNIAIGKQHQFVGILTTNTNPLTMVGAHMNKAQQLCGLNDIVGYNLLTGFFETVEIFQQIGRDLHGYEILSEYQVNEYVAPDGVRPFELAPNSFKIICCWKRLQ